MFPWVPGADCAFPCVSSGFYDPTFGEVLVNGVPLRHFPVRIWRRMLGYVGQHPVLFATSALENIKACWQREDRMVGCFPTVFLR